MRITTRTPRLTPGLQPFENLPATYNRIHILKGDGLICLFIETQATRV